MLVVVAVDGAPTFNRIALGSFDRSYRWVQSFSVPAGLLGLEITFQAFGFDVLGNLVTTNRETVTFP